MIALSPRLAAAAQLVLRDKPMADIGTDHAYLPAYLVQAGAVPRAIAADMKSGPLQAARTTLAEEGLQAQVELRLGNGLSVLNPREVATAAICGMGGLLIAAILAAGPTAGLERLVLQPNCDEPALRRWLAANGWRISAEQLAEDSGRIYVVMAVEPGAMTLTEIDELIGPYVRVAGGPLLVRYAGTFLAWDRKALEGARRSGKPEAAARVQELEHRIHLLEEVIAHADHGHRGENRPVH